MWCENKGKGNQGDIMKCRGKQATEDDNRACQKLRYHAQEV